MTDRFEVAIFADVHGNKYALEVVLADIEAQSPDLVVFAGDLVTKGPHPAECLTLIKALNIPGIMGNTDHKVIEGSGAVAIWNQDQIGEDGLDYLRSLPTSQRISPPNGRGSQDDLLIVHSTPRSCYDLLILEPKRHDADPLFMKVTLEEEAIQMLAGASASLIVYGHIHFVSKGVIAGQRIESMGSVGFPFDQDHRAAYAIAHWDPDQRVWNLEHRRVAYGYERMIADLERSTQPYIPRAVKMIRGADWFPREKRS
ncbi:MAG: putative phosphodiesterase [Cellvibrionaceae bacterium]|jgi:predicted phosphodiesterase